MRDLHAVASTERVDLGEPEALPVGDVQQSYLATRRDQTFAGIAVLMLDSAKILEPIVGMLSGHLLRWAALGGLIGLASFALRQPSWEKLAIVGVFGIVAPWVIRRGKL